MRTADRLARNEQHAAQERIFARRRELFLEERPVSSAVIEPRYIDDVLEGVCVDGLSLGEC